jgi:hypothetical protein
MITPSSKIVFLPSVFMQMRRATFIFLAAIMLAAGCVSRKKYEGQVELTSRYQDMYNSLKHDSLLMAQRIDSLVQDSADTHKRLDELSKKSGGGGEVTVKYYKPATMTKEREHKLKTIYIYNIANGIEWDAKYSKEKFRIGVIGKTGLTAVLIKELSNKKKGLQDFTIVEYEKVSEIGNCHMLVVSKSFYKSLPQIKARVKDFPTLLISEEDYKAQGAHFNLAPDGDELRMNANKELLKKNGFTVSKSLLSNTE